MDIVFEITLSFSAPIAADPIPVVFKWSKKETPTLADLRKKIKLREDKFGADWKFKNTSSMPLKKKSEASYDLERYYNDEQAAVYQKRLKKGAKSGNKVNAPNLSIEIYAPNGDQPVIPVVPADTRDKTKVILVLGESESEVQFGDKKPGDISLDAIRSQVEVTVNNELPNTFKFLNADGLAIKKNKEETIMLPSMDPAPTVKQGWGVYKVVVWVKDAIPGKWDGTIPEPPELVTLPDVAEPTPISDSVPTLPEFPPFDSSTEFATWGEVEKEVKLKVATNLAQLYYGFNLPDINMGSINPAMETRDASTPNYLMGNKMVLIPESDVDVGGSVESVQHFNTEAGYSRREVDIKRSLQVTTSAQVSYEDVAGAEAEFSYARRFASNSQEEKFFLYCDVLIEKARLNLPFVDQSLDRTQIKVLPEFIRRFDRIKNTAELFNLMREYGSLIARKVTLGGLVRVTEEKTITQDFVAQAEKIAWSVSAQGSKGPLTVKVSNQGEIDEEKMQQSNNQFSRTNIETLGGISSYSIAKDMPGWVGSLSKVKHWAPIRREDIVPIYLLLDVARQARFVDLLNQGGQRFWQQSAILPQLRLINFDWYLQFYESDVYGDLD